jgi:hypothetical protein
MIIESLKLTENSNYNASDKPLQKGKSKRKKKVEGKGCTHNFLSKRLQKSNNNTNIVDDANDDDAINFDVQVFSCNYLYKLDIRYIYGFQQNMNSSTILCSSKGKSVLICNFFS